VSRHFDDLNTVLEFDASDDFRQWFSPVNRRQVFAAAVRMRHPNGPMSVRRELAPVFQKSLRKTSLPHASRTILNGRWSGQ
jgi:hypothetical protein